MQLKSSLLLIAATIVVASCSQDTTPAVPLPGDYYPTTNARRYLRESLNPATKEIFMTDTIQIFYDADVTYKDKTYAKLDFLSKWLNADNVPVINRDVYTLFRKEAGQYFTPYSSDSSEYIFLDTQKGVGSSWTIYQGFENESKIIYTVKAVNAIRVVNGVTYKNVIEILQEVYSSFNKGPYELGFSETSYYAKDIGRIYRRSDFYTYPGTLRITLLDK